MAQTGYSAQYALRSPSPPPIPSGINVLFNVDSVALSFHAAAQSAVAPLSLFPLTSFPCINLPSNEFSFYRRQFSLSLCAAARSIHCKGQLVKITTFTKQFIRDASLEAFSPKFEVSPIKDIMCSAAAARRNERTCERFARPFLSEEFAIPAHTASPLLLPLSLSIDLGIWWLRLANFCVHHLHTTTSGCGSAEFFGRWWYQ